MIRVSMAGLKMMALTGMFAAAALEAEDATTQGRFLGAMDTTYPSWFKSSFLEIADDVEEALANGRRVLILYHQDDCPYCNALVERNLSQKHIEEKVRENFDVIALNLRGDREVVTIDGQVYTEKSLARALDVQFTPTLFFLDESGQVVLRLNGYVPPGEFEIALDFASGKPEAAVTYQDYLAGRLSPADDGAMNEAGFFSAPPHDFRAVVEQRRPAAVFFEQRQCPNCDVLHADTLRDPESTDLIEGFYAAQLDMWSGEPLVTPSGERTTAREWARDLGVKYAPTIVLFSPEGREVIRSEAWLKRFHTQSLLDYVSSEAYREEPDFQRYLSARADRIRAQGRDVDIWE